MTGGKRISDIARVKGVHQYLWIDRDGTIQAHNMENPEQLAQMAVSCAGPLFAMGKKNFKYLGFLRRNQANFFIFPVGNGYVGVIKQERIGDEEVVQAITEFLDTCFGSGSN